MQYSIFSTSAAAREDTAGLLRAPGLLLAIKRAVDEDRRPGRFLLTGPASVMTLPKVSNSLAGRKWKCGVLLYDGVETLPMGPGLWAVPLSTLWLN